MKANPILPSPLADRALALVRAAETAEAARDLPFRNTLALVIFGYPRHVKIGDRTVETWHDPQSRNWITQIFDGTRELRPADYTGDRLGAAVAHFWALSRALDPADRD